MRSEKNSYVVYGLRFIFMSGLFLLSVLVWVTFVEYRFFCKEAQSLLALKAQYRFYVRDMQKKNDVADTLMSDAAGVRGEQWGVRGDDFIVVNRDPGYLRDSMIDYLKDSQLDGVLSRVNIQDWQEYPGHISIDGNVAPVKRKKVAIARPVKRYASKKTKKIAVGGAHTSFFSWPLETDQFWLSSLFGPRKKPNGSWGMHTGIDMAAIKGTPVKAVAAGLVGESRYASGYGNTVVLHHNNRYKTRFAHLDKIFVKRGQQINRGQVIGTVGATGFIRKKGKDGSHLHFEVYSYNKHINPLTVLPVLT